MREHRLLATAEHRAALRAAAVRRWWERPTTWVRAAASVLLLAAGLSLYDVPWPAVVTTSVAVPAAMLGLARLRFGRAMDQRLAASWADGTEHSTRFDDEGFASHGPLGGVDYRLRALRSVRRRGGVVEVALHPRGTALVVAELFPVEEEERLARALRQPG